MIGRKIEQVNKFMADAVELVEEVAFEREIRIPIRVIEFILNNDLACRLGLHKNHI